LSGLSRDRVEGGEGDVVMLLVVSLEGLTGHEEGAEEEEDFGAAKGEVDPGTCIGQEGCCSQYSLLRGVELLYLTGGVAPEAAMG
jgi:hypothetical protein